MSTARSETAWRTCQGCGRSFRAAGHREEYLEYCPTCDYRRIRHRIEVEEERVEEETDAGE